jgi:hypothetical protein
MKPFEKWETEEVERTFGITQVDTFALMDTWLAYQTTFTPQTQEIAEKLRIRHKKMADFWSEEDIKVFFIMPIIELVEFYEPNVYRTFMEASLQADLVDVHNNPCTLRGRVEMVVATGKQRPQTPFFFLNEYKPQIKAQADPKGQLLIAMLAAQAKNNGLNLPIYGLYTIGQFWFFVVLAGKEYSISKAFDGTDALEVAQILCMLQFVKEHIERNV